MSRAQAIPMLLSGIQDTSGVPLNGGTVNFYAAGTTSDQAVYSDQAKSTAAANPYTLDSNGQAQLYADGNYKLVIKDSGGSTLYTWDNLLFGLDDATSVWAGTATGSSNAYAITPSPAITVYAEGQTFSFLANHTSSGAATLNVNGLGATTLKNTDGSAIGASDLVSGGLYNAAYNGTDFQLTGAAISTPIDVASGGTGGSTQSAAQQGLGVEVGVDVQAQDDFLDDISGLAPGDDHLIVHVSGSYLTQALSGVLDRIARSTWAPTAPRGHAGAADTSSITVNDAFYHKYGNVIYFTYSINFTIDNATPTLYVDAPLAGTAHDSNVNLFMTMLDGGGSSGITVGWRYVGGTTLTTNGFIITKLGGGNFSTGVNAAIHVSGSYPGA